MAVEEPALRPHTQGVEAQERVLELTGGIERLRLPAVVRRASSMRA